MPAFITEFHQTHIFPTHLSKTGFLMLVLSSLLVAAAGYIINDVHDVSIDEVNKPGKNLIGKKYSEQFAKKLFYWFSGIAIAIGFYLALAIQKNVMGFIQVFAVVSLYMYSSSFKKRLFIGNLIIALLAALAVAIVGLYEPSIYLNIEFVLYYAAFAFIVTLTREIIKDIEDFDGDELAQRKTIPIVFGVKIAKTIIISLIIITLAGLMYLLWKYFYMNKVTSFINLIGMFLIPFLALSYLVITAHEKKDYYYASLFTKAIMVYGLLSIIPFWYYFLR